MRDGGNNRRMKQQAIVGSLIVMVLVLGLGYAIAADEGSLATRLQKVEDEKEIRDLMVDYGRTLDAGNFAAYSGLFAKNGEWSGLLPEFTTVKGRENIRTAMEKNFKDRKYDPKHVTNLHVFSNMKITVQGDRATGYSRWTVLSRNDRNEPYPRVSGRYEDTFIREDGHWKFQSRLAQREIP